MAEFLVKAKANLNGKGKEIGDIIVVRPDGWKWGGKEQPPNYVVISIPDISFEDAKEYEKSLYEPRIREIFEDKTGKVVRITENEGIVLKQRKHKFPIEIVNQAKQNLKGRLALTNPGGITNIIEKTKNGN